MGRVPRLPRYYEGLRLPALRSASLRFLRSAVPPSALLSAPSKRGARRLGAWRLVTRSPAGTFRWREQGLPGSWGIRSRACRALIRPRWSPDTRPTSVTGCCLPGRSTLSASTSVTFGARSLSLRARCLRLAAGVSPTHPRLASGRRASLDRAGLATRWIPSEGFCFQSIAFSFTRLLLAHGPAQPS